LAANDLQELSGRGRRGSRTCCIGITRSQISRGLRVAIITIAMSPRARSRPMSPIISRASARAQRRERLVEQKDAR
jgi:hypothetical protein